MRCAGRRLAPPFRRGRLLFYLQLDKYLEEEEAGRNHFVLHSMLIHSGDVNGGHYFAYIRPRLKNEAGELSNQWCGSLLNTLSPLCAAG